MGYCINCGKKLNDNDKYCGACGTKVTRKDEDTPLIVPPILKEPIDEMAIDNPEELIKASNNIKAKDDVHSFLNSNKVNEKEENVKEEVIAPVVENTKKKSGALKYFLIPLIAIALGIGVWYITKNSNNEAASENKETVSEEVNNNEENVEEVEVSEEPSEEVNLNKEGREVGVIIQTREEIDSTLAQMDAMEYLEKEKLLNNLTNSYNRFSMNMIRNTITKGENYVSSPLSLYSALGLLSNAASGKTLEELNSVLGLSNDELNRTMYEYMKGCKSWEGVEILKFGNSVWLNGDMGFEINESYRDIVTSYYDSDVYTESFTDNKNTIDKMNGWVEEHTDGSIKDLFDESTVNPATTFVLANALSFDDKWLHEFDPNENTDEVFHNLDGSNVKTKMMHSTESKYWDDGKALGVSKPLINGASVVFILPNEGVDIYEYLNELPDDVFSKFEENSIFETNRTETSVEEHYTHLTVPKFKYDVTLDLNDALVNMGLSDIFKEDANLSKMLNKDYESLYVSSVIQKATVDLNEEGISAKAATMVGGMGAAGGITIIYKYHDLVLDRPFIYAIVKDDIPCFVGVITTFDGESVSEAEIKEAEGDKIGTVTVNVDKLNIRSIPSTSGEKLGKVQNGKTYDVYETKTAEGYTWYRIGEGEWIADDGTWLTYKN